MKKRFTILAAVFALLAFLAIPMGMRGQTATFGPDNFSGQGTSGTGSAISATVDGVTFACDKGYGTTQIRCYSGSTITISSSNTITAISFTFSGSYTGGLETSYTDLSTSSWTRTLASQARITACSVSYTDGGTPTPTAYTVTYDCNGGTSGCPENVTGITTGTSITLAAAPTKTDYTFDGWNDGSTTYEAGANYTVNGNVTMTAQWIENTPPTPGGETATLNIQAYAEANNWTNGTKYTVAEVAPVTFTANGGGNTGKYYTSGQDWRFYQNENASITISVSGGYTLVSVTPTYSVSNGGVLNNGNTAITSGTSESVSGTSVTFTVGNSGSATNGQVRFTNIDVTYVPNGDPYIMAEDIELPFDAIGGSIYYTINNFVDGGTISANVTEGNNWLTLTESDEFHYWFECSVNELSAARTATITLTYTYNTDQVVTKNVIVTQAANPNAVNNISEITAAGTYTVQGTIVAKSARGFIVGDGTGYVYYYNQNYTQSDYNIGDMVKLAGPVVVYGGVYEFNNSTTITTATSSNYVAEDPTVLTGEQMDARVASTTPPQLSSYVQYEGTFSINDTHYNITDIVGATTAIGSISYPLNDEEITALDGKYVKVTGYYVGISSSTYYNTMLGSIEEIATSNPSIAAEDVSIEYNATTGAIAYTINNPVSGGVLTAATESEWLTLGAVGTTVPFTCTANTTASPRTATVILTYTYNTDQIVTKNVTVTQAGNPNTIDNISDITAAGTYTVQGTIVAISNRGFILGDGTGYVYYYYGAEFEYGDYDIGDVVKLSGPVVVYGGVFEFDSNTSITYVEESNYVEEDPTVLSGADMDARVASTTPAQLSSYVQYEGTFTISGTHYNVTNISGATTAIGSISYPLNSDEITALNNKQVKVTGYYVGISSSTYYNTMIGSIEEVEVQHEEYTLTVSNLVNVNTYVFDAAVESEMLLEGEGSVQILDGTMVMISVDVEEGYAIESLMVDGTNVTSQIDETGAYTFTMPTHNVTITATAVEIIAPTDDDYVRITSLNQLTDGSIVVIASRYNADATNYYAMKNTISGGKAQGEEFVSTTSNGNEILPASIVDNVNDYYWVVNLTENGYMFTNANGDVISYNSSTNFNMNGDKDTWNVVRNTSGMALVPNYEGFVITNTKTTDRGIAMRVNDGSKIFGAYSTSNTNGDTYNFFLDFFVQNAASGTVTQTIELTAGWNWISTYIDLNEVDGMTLLKEALGDYATMIQTYSESADYFGDGEWAGLEDYVWTNGEMIMVEVVEDCTITLAGPTVDPSTVEIEIYPEWNWIGFPVATETPIEVALAGFEPEDEDAIQGYAGTSDYMDEWLGDVMTLVPGQGYMYLSNSTEPKTLVFQMGAKARRNTKSGKLIKK